MSVAGAIPILRLGSTLLVTLHVELHDEIASQFQVDVLNTIQRTHGTELVALGGGVFQNARLLSSLTQRLEARVLQPLVPRTLSPNDGAISYGQAAVAAARLRREGAE